MSRIVSEESIYNILLIGAEGPGREARINALRGAGFRVRVAREGTEALALARSERPDAVLSDTGAAGAAELIRCLRADGVLRQTPILMLDSGEDRSPGVDEALRADADDFIAEPHNPELLVKRVQRFLEVAGAVRQLRETREHFRAQFRSNPVPAYVWRRSGEDFALSDYNDAALIITRGHIRNLLGTKLSALYQSKPDVLADFERCYRERRSVRREMAFKLITTGEVRRLAITYVYLSPDSVVAHTVDVTERTLTERVLRESHHRVESILESITDGFYALDREWRFTYVNHQAECILGRGRDELLGNNLWELFPRLDENEIGRQLKRTAAEGATVKFEAFSEVLGMWLCLSIYPFDGGLSVYFRDVTEVKRAAARLRESEERHRLLFEATPVPMWVYDSGTLAFLAVNEAATRHYGYTREEFLSMTIKDIRPAEDVPRMLETLAAGCEGRREIGISRHLTKDGRLMLVNVTLHKLEFEGRPAGLVLSQDVTEKVALEDRLRQSERMEAVGQLAGGVAHDFNNLLTTILGYAELTLRGGQTGRQVRQNATEIRDAAQRAALLTNQLLAFSRRLMLRPRELHLNELVADMLDELRQLAGARAEIEVTSAHDLATVKADPGQLRQVLINLVSNAADAMPGGGRLRISTENVELASTVVRPHDIVPPGRYVCLTVSDEGHGMSEEVLARAFEPFFTTKEVGQGTGLGLSTVFGVVKQSGGYVTAESEEGAGTTVRVYLPRLD